jgi:hypothetical protein
MSGKSLVPLMSALVCAALAMEPVAAAAKGLSHLETWGAPQGRVRTVPNARCDGLNGMAGAYGHYQPGGPIGAYGYARPVMPGTVLAQGSGAVVLPRVGTGYVPAGPCHVVDTTVVKAIHAICVSADGHEFPASHMTGDTWINAGYAGEIARCLPGSVLKVIVGSVMMSDQGLAVSLNDAQVLSCGTGMAVRHFKDGMLKCAIARKVPDCTERTNLRKWGTGDMFFTYATRVCAEWNREIAGGQSRMSSGYSVTMTEEQASMAATAAAARARELQLRGARLNGGVGRD